jgi:pimeloyl-ACP methyl ester carboxylesterase
MTLKATTDDGVTIAYDVTGSGPDVVFVHGITDDRTSWAPIVERLAASRRCVTLDLRGHGESGDAGDYGALAMASDVTAVMSAAGCDQPLLVGHSLGGMVVTAVAPVAAVRGVINVDQSLRISDFKAALEPIAPMLRGSEDEFRAALAMVFGVLSGERDEPQIAARVATCLARARQDVVLGVWSLVFDIPAGELDALIDAMAPSIAVPYLTILGDDAGPDYREWLRDRIGHVEIEEWPGHGHFLHLVDPARFVARVQAFAP